MPSPPSSRDFADDMAHRHGLNSNIAAGVSMNFGSGCRRKRFIVSSISLSAAGLSSTRHASADKLRPHHALTPANDVVG